MSETPSTPAQPEVPNRQTPFSAAFREFIVGDWAPYPSALPDPLPATSWTPARRAAIAALFPGETLVIPAGPYKIRSNDTDYRFRPHSAFAYLSGLGEDREPDSVLVLHSSGESVLYFKPRSPRTDPEFYASARYGEMWVGQRESLEEMAALTGLECRHIDSFGAELDQGAPIRVLAEADPAITAQVNEARSGSHDDADHELEVALSEARLIKDAFEIGEMRSACAATAVSFEAVGAAAGAGLGVAGLLVQRAMRNPLAVPDLLGVSGGAAFVAALLVTNGIHSLTARTAGALAGALAGGALCLLAAARGRSAAQTLLIGAAISTAWQAAVLTVMSTADQVELSIIFKYLVGSLTEVTADVALPLTVPLLIGCAATVAVLPALGVLSLGDEQASALGMRPGRWRLLALGVAALLVALVVAACGPIAWVAFVAPTVTRWFVPAAGEVFRLAVTAIIGAGVSVGADIAARELFKPFETPLGAWTALIGFCVAMVFVAGRTDR